VVTALDFLGVWSVLATTFSKAILVGGPPYVF
jgi:hypothetical protein